MKWLHAIALVAITSCLALSPCLADDAFNTDIPNTDIPQPSAQTPAVLELTPDIPAAVDKLKAPNGQYKQLADVAIAEITKQNPQAKVVAYLREKPNAKPDLVLAYNGAESTVLTFASNCSVNSQFNVQNAALAALMDPDRHEKAPDLSGHLLTGICAHWTLLNHDWTAQEAVLPKKYKVSAYNGRIDISYDHQQVRDYNAKVAATIRSRSVNIAKR